MFGISAQEQPFEPEKFNLPSPEPKREGELDEAGEKTKSAKIYPFVRPGEQKPAESLEEKFYYQDVVLISNNEVIARFYKGFPTKVILKEKGVYEVVEKKPTGVKSYIFEKVDEIRFG